MALFNGCAVMFNIKDAVSGAPEGVIQNHASIPVQYLNPHSSSSTWYSKYTYRLTVMYRCRGNGTHTPSRCSSLLFYVQWDNWAGSRSYFHGSAQSYKELGQFVCWQYTFTVPKDLTASNSEVYLGSAIDGYFANGFDNQDMDVYCVSMEFLLDSSVLGYNHTGKSDYLTTMIYTKSRTTGKATPVSMLVGYDLNIEDGAIYIKNVKKSDSPATVPTGKGLIDITACKLLFGSSEKTVTIRNNYQKTICYAKTGKIPYISLTYRKNGITMLPYAMQRVAAVITIEYTDVTSKSGYCKLSKFDESYLTCAIQGLDLRIWGTTADSSWIELGKVITNTCRIESTGNILNGNRYGTSYYPSFYLGTATRSIMVGYDHFPQGGSVTLTIADSQGKFGDVYIGQPSGITSKWD